LVNSARQRAAGETLSPGGIRSASGHALRMGHALGDGDMCCHANTRGESTEEGLAGQRCPNA